MNKEEAKQKIASILEKLPSIRDELISLEIEANNEYLAVKPYDVRDLLTREQDEMKEWFRELRQTAYEAKWAISDMENYFGLLCDQTTQEGRTMNDKR